VHFVANADILHIVVEDGRVARFRGLSSSGGGLRRLVLGGSVRFDLGASRFVGGRGSFSSRLCRDRSVVLLGSSTILSGSGIQSSGLGSSIFLSTFEVLEVEGELKSDELLASSSLELGEGELSAAARIVATLDLIVLGDVATLGGLGFGLGNDSLVVFSDSLASLLVESDLLEGGSRLKLGNEIVHLFARTRLEEDVIFIGLTHVGNKALRVKSAQVDGHKDLLFEIILIRARPWLVETLGVVLLKERALGHLGSRVFAAHCDL